MAIHSPAPPKNLKTSKPHDVANFGEVSDSWGVRGIADFFDVSRLLEFPKSATLIGCFYKNFQSGNFFGAIDRGKNRNFTTF